MGNSQVRRGAFVSLVLAFLLATALSAANPDEVQVPNVGDTIEDYTFRTLAGKELKLGELNRQGPIVIVVLRGYPGYQCPACTKQVAELRKNAEELQKLKKDL